MITASFQKRCVSVQNENKITFINKYEGGTDIKIISGDLTLKQLVDVFKEFCLACTYSPVLVNKIQYIEQEDD